MFPEGFIRRIRDQKYIDSEALFNAMEETSTPSIRINPYKWNKSPLNAESVPWCRNGYYLVTRPSYTFDPLFHSGCYYPQEASGMFLEQILKQTSDFSENYRVLDLCGAPGGKSTHLSELIGPENLLVANETIRSRAIILAETITKWGSVNTIVTQNDPAVFGKLSGYFDIIIVDAPCSGEGMFRSGTAVREWSVVNTLHCAERQKRILMDVWPALKENGLMIYSTCTFNPGENEENIKWLIGKHKADIVRINIDDFPGIKEIDYQGIYGYGFYPGKVRGEGLFLSVIRKTGKQEKSHIRSQYKSELKPVKEDFKIADSWTSFSRDRLLKWGVELFAVSCNMDDYLHLYQNLKITKAGTKIFIVKNNDYLPSPELALSIQLKTGAFPGNEVDLYEALAFMRRDNFALQNAIKGWNIVTYKGVCLGFVKNIGNRLNNYFPVEWRIRMNLPESDKENIIKWDQEDKLM
jgi:16S rRNA C967 or C1407 C5-methylase (RsmB/RsmF family)/NOL1/NOP2/fmu family ribosome biogenesis protein